MEGNRSSEPLVEAIHTNSSCVNVQVKKTITDSYDARDQVGRLTIPERGIRFENASWLRSLWSILQYDHTRRICGLRATLRGDADVQRTA